MNIEIYFCPNETVKWLNVWLCSVVILNDVVFMNGNIFALKWAYLPSQF